MKLTLIDNTTGKTKIYKKQGGYLTKILKEDKYRNLPDNIIKLKREFETLKRELDNFHSMDLDTQKTKLAQYHNLYVQLQTKQCL